MLSTTAKINIITLVERASLIPKWSFGRYAAIRAVKIPEVFIHWILDVS